MKTFLEWIQTISENAHLPSSFFYKIIDEPRDLLNYLVAADYLEENNLPDYAQLLRMCIQYGNHSGKSKSDITRKINAIIRRNGDLLSNVEGFDSHPELKKQLYSLRLHKDYKGGKYYTYNSRMDRKNWTNNEPPEGLENHPNPDSPFTYSTDRENKFGKDVSDFPPEVLATMIFYILLSNNPEIHNLLKQSKSLFQNKAFTPLMSRTDWRSPINGETAST